MISAAPRFTAHPCIQTGICLKAHGLCDMIPEGGGENMSAFANSLPGVIAITFLMLIMVFVLPASDRRICRKLGLNLEGGLSRNPNAERLMRIRHGILYALFALYLLAAAYIVFFSRSAGMNYQVHIALFQDLRESVQIDLGFLGFIKAVFSDGFSAAVTHISIVSPEDIAQVYMNTMLFVPMGYLLPYVFSWFRERVRVRPAAACFLISLVIENLQLIFRRGFYDIDDLFSNTIGGIIGQFLFLSFAYVVTHPAWRRELKQYRTWKKNAKARTLYPFTRRMTLSRAALQATMEEDIWDFYVMKLGFRLISQIVPMDCAGTDMLLQMGRFQVEVHCSNSRGILPPQTLTLSARRLPPIIRRLNRNGIKTDPVSQDPYTGLKRITFDGPDGVTVCILER